VPDVSHIAVYVISMIFNFIFANSEHTEQTLKILVLVKQHPRMIINADSVRS